MLRHPLSIVAAGLFLAGGCFFLRAGSYQVQPVRIELSTGHPTTTVQVRNRAAAATTIQAHVSAWSADGTEEILTESTDLILNPPIFTVGGGQSQVMRVGLRRPLPAGIEGTYRLILEEVPPPARTNFTGVTTLLKLSVPIFVRPAAPSPDLVWGMHRLSDENTQVWVENHGNAHVQIRSLDIARGDVGELEFRNDKMAYVLPDGRKEWVVPGARFGSAGMKVRAETDIGEIRATIDPDTR